MTEADMTALEALRTRPFPIAPPRRSRRVNTIMWLSRRTGIGAPTDTPHLHGGTNRQKVEFEYAHAEDFWELLSGFVSPTDLEGKDVIDIGCGWGGKAVRYAETIALRSITGLDLPDMIDIPEVESLAGEHGVQNVSFHTGVAENMEFPDESFDVAFMEDVLEHVRDPAAVLSEAHRVLRPGGLFVARFPSIRGVFAHHLDRAISLPGVHYLVPLSRWAEGLNYYLLHTDGASFEPFSRVVDSEFRRAITENLNGLSFESFGKVAHDSPFEVRSLSFVKHPAPKTSWRAKAAYPLYDGLWRFPKLRETLSLSIVFVGRRPATR